MLPELLSPAGSLDAALAAFQYGADAIYLGLPRFSARADADNLSPERLRALLGYARSFSPQKKIYVTFNTLLQDVELPLALELLDTLNDLTPDGLIVQDLGLARLVRDNFPRLALHASTQLAAHNIDGVRALSELGFTRVVLARELSLSEIRRIAREGGVEIEVFVHGALCYSFSGLCLFSSHTAGRSGNRGRCAYCCREAFTQQSETGKNPSHPAALYPFSMKDLALAPLLDRVVATGVHSLKIEGRMKSPIYVACVTDYYRRKLDGRLSPQAEIELVQDLQTVFSRPWTSLYADGLKAAPETIIDPVAVGHRGARIGIVDAVVLDRGMRWLRFKTGRALEKHDGLQVELPGGGKPFGCAVNALRTPGSAKPVISLPAGSVVEVALPASDVPVLPRGAPVFCSASQAVRRRYEIQGIREGALPSGRRVEIQISLASDGIKVRATSSFAQPGDITAETRLPLVLTRSRQPDQTLPAIRKAFERLGDTAWQLGSITLDDPSSLYAPPSKLNEARRSVIDALTARWAERRTEKRSGIAASWGFGPAAVPPPDVCGRPGPRSVSWSLKLRADAAPLAADALAPVQTLVLQIGHTPFSDLDRHLARWTSLMSQDLVLLALPLITRQHESAALKETVSRLIGSGWTRWECADLAGHRLLAEDGLTPISADWSFYATNRIATAELARLGLRSFVLSPENTRENVRALLDATRLPGHTHAAPELLVYQHTPLFISETAPCLPQMGSAFTLSDRRGRTFFTRHLDNRWVTVWQQAFCVADRLVAAGFHRARIDLSYSPEPERFSSLIRTICSSTCPSGTHPANFDRGLL